MSKAASSSAKLVRLQKRKTVDTHVMKRPCLALLLEATLFFVTVDTAVAVDAAIADLLCEEQRVGRFIAVTFLLRLGPFDDRQVQCDQMATLF